jgi:hypothetical protein
VPTDLVYVPRKVWVIEGNAKDPYYNYGKHLFYVDQETYGIWHEEVFDKAGVPWIWQFRLEDHFESPNGLNNAGLGSNGCTYDMKARHASWGQSYNETTYYLPASWFPLERFNSTELLKQAKK